MIRNHVFFSFAVKPLSVQILTKEREISADRRYDVECRSIGSRPEAVITWWKGNRQMKRISKNVSYPLLCYVSQKVLTIIMHNRMCLT